jgi:D-alanyl-D-alanine endopeptidase (penicillin-binding protein 7)
MIWPGLAAAALLLALLFVQDSFWAGSELAGSPTALAHTPPAASDERSLADYLDPRRLSLRSDVALVMDELGGEVLYEKKAHQRQPIASLTKLMTAMVVLDADLPKDEVITITRADRDRLRGSASKLSFGTKLTRQDLLKIALAGSDNRAAAALARTYPGGTAHFIATMNDKARRLGLAETAFRDPAGLHSGNVSTAVDLARLVTAASRYPSIRTFTTLEADAVTDRRTGWKVRFVNTNRLVRNSRWEIDLSKTGYIAAAGHCLVMRAELADRTMTVVLLNSWGSLTKYGDANRIRQWLDRAEQKAQRVARAL